MHHYQRSIFLVPRKHMNKLQKILLGTAVTIGLITSSAFLYINLTPKISQSLIAGSIAAGWTANSGIITPTTVNGVSQNVQVSKTASGTVGPELRLNNPSDTAGDQYLLSIYDGTSGSPYRGALQWTLSNVGQAQLDIYGGGGATVGAMTKIASFLPSGSTQLLGTTTSSNIGNLGGWLDPALMNGSDIGAKFNNGYTGGACSTKGCGFFVSQPASGLEWNFSTPITFTTHYHPVLLTCASGGGGVTFSLGGGTVLNYTGTTGNAISFDTNEYVLGGTGIVNCDIHGPGSAASSGNKGVVLGTSVGSFNTQLKSVTVSGFDTGVYLGPNTSFDWVDGSVLNYNARNFSEPDTSGANCENTRITNSVLADAQNEAGGALDLFGLYLQESGNCQLNAGFNSFDDNQIYFDQFGGTANINTIVASHQENPNLDVYPMIATHAGGANIVTSLIGGDAMNDTVAGQVSQFNVAGAINMIGFTSDANNNVTVPITRIVNALASSTAINWAGLSCRGANYTSFVYGRIPCSPFGVASDYGLPSLYVASSTSKGVGIVDIATSTTNMDTAFPAALNIGVNPATTNASSTINMKRLQFQGESSTGVVSCAYVVGTAWVIEANPCKN